MNCHDFSRIIGFVASQAANDKAAARNTWGVHFVFEDDRLTLRASQSGSTTTVELHDPLFAGKSAFMVTHDDLRLLKAPLAYELNRGGQTELNITIGYQPTQYIRKAVQITIGDWWEGWVGVQNSKLPVKYPSTPRGKIRMEDIAEAAHSLFKVSNGKSYSHVVSTDGKSAIIELAEPLFGINKVTKEVY